MEPVPDSGLSRIDRFISARLTSTRDATVLRLDAHGAKLIGEDKVLVLDVARAVEHDAQDIGQSQHPAQLRAVRQA